MRSFGTATVLITLLALTGCGSGDGDADDVPTITTRPSVSATSTATTATSAPSTDATTETSSTPSAPATSEPTSTETAGPSPEPPTDDPVGPTTYRQALARLGDEPTIAEGVSRFVTDDDVIYCLLDDPVIGPACELSRGFIKDGAACGGSAAEGVGRVETYQGRARPVCPTDTIREPGAQAVLGDGVISNGAGVECLVDRFGVTCVDRRARVGFFLAPGEYHVF